MSTAKRVVIDTDPGIDDALALILAFLSPELRIEAVTTVSGNVPVEQATRNVFRVLDLLDLQTRPIVAKGAHPTSKEPLATAARVHGSDGLGGLDRFEDADGSPRYADVDLPSDPPDAASTILDLLGLYPEELTVICLGPLTNIGHALSMDAGRMRRVKELLIMGGAIRVPGNITAAAEFNIFADPEAAKQVFASRLPAKLIPLDVTEKVRLDVAEVDKLAADTGGSLGRFLSDVTSGVLSYMGLTYGKSEIVLHDPLTVGVAVESNIVKTTALHVDIEAEGEITKGMTLADLRPIRNDLKRPPNLKVALDVNAERFKTLFQERLCQRSS